MNEGSNNHIRCHDYSRYLKKRQFILVFVLIFYLFKYADGFTPGRKEEY